MRNKMKFTKGRCAVLGMVSALVMFSQVSMAGSYHSNVTLPTVHSKGHTYMAHLPVTGVSQPGGRVSSVSWNWNYVGFPRGLVVLLCQGTVNNCEDVSRRRSGSTNRFVGGNPSQPLFFTIHVANNRSSSSVPIGGLGGAVTVSW